MIDLTGDNELPKGLLHSTQLFPRHKKSQTAPNGSAARVPKHACEVVADELNGTVHIRHYHSSRCGVQDVTQVRHLHKSAICLACDHVGHVFPCHAPAPFHTTTRYCCWPAMQLHPVSRLRRPQQPSEDFRRERSFAQSALGAYHPKTESDHPTIHLGGD